MSFETETPAETVQPIEKTQAPAGAEKLSYEKLEEYHEKAIADNVKYRKSNSEYKERLKDMEEQARKVPELEESLSKTKQQARERVAKADFRARLRSEGIEDADVLKMVPLDTVEYDDDGEPKNADEVWSKFQEAKSYLFGNKPASTVSTSSVHKAPAPKITEVDWMTVSAEEMKRASKPSKLR